MDRTAGATSFEAEIRSESLCPRLECGHGIVDPPEILLVPTKTSLLTHAQTPAHAESRHSTFQSATFDPQAQAAPTPRSSARIAQRRTPTRLPNSRCNHPKWDGNSAIFVEKCNQSVGKDISSPQLSRRTPTAAAAFYYPFVWVRQYPSAPSVDCGHLVGLVQRAILLL